MRRLLLPFLLLWAAKARAQSGPEPGRRNGLYLELGGRSPCYAEAGN